MRSRVPKRVLALGCIKGQDRKRTVALQRRAQVDGFAVHLCGAGGFIKSRAKALCNLRGCRALLVLLDNAIF